VLHTSTYKTTNLDKSQAFCYNVLMSKTFEYPLPETAAIETHPTALDLIVPSEGSPILAATKPGQVLNPDGEWFTAVDHSSSRYEVGPILLVTGVGDDRAEYVVDHARGIVFSHLGTPKAAMRKLAADGIPSSFTIGKQVVFKKADGAPATIGKPLTEAYMKQPKGTGFTEVDVTRGILGVAWAHTDRPTTSAGTAPKVGARVNDQSPLEYRIPNQINEFLRTHK
jgi:hypothetical protein